MAWLLLRCKHGTEKGVWMKYSAQRQQGGSQGTQPPCLSYVGMSCTQAANKHRLCRQTMTAPLLLHKLWSGFCVTPLQPLQQLETATKNTTYKDYFIYYTREHMRHISDPIPENIQEPYSPLFSGGFSFSFGDPKSRKQPLHSHTLTTNT